MQDEINDYKIYGMTTQYLGNCLHGATHRQYELGMTKQLTGNYHVAVEQLIESQCKTSTAC